MVECDLDIDLSWQGTLILNIFKVMRKTLILLGFLSFSRFYALPVSLWEKFDIL